MTTFQCPNCSGTGAEPGTRWTNRYGETTVWPCTVCGWREWPLRVGEIDEVECAECSRVVVAEDAADARTCKRCAVEVVR